MMLGQGVGPLSKFLSKRAAAGAFNSADCIVVRDPESARALVALGVRQTARVGADLAFMMPPAREEGEQQFGVAGMKTVGIAPRPFGKNNKEVVVLFGDLCRMLFQTQHVPVLIEMDRNEDGPLISEIEKSQGGKVPSMKKLATPIQVQSRIARMDAVIGMRLHASILATGVGVPAMTISYDPKVAAFANILGLGSAIPIEGLTAQRLFDNYLTFEKAKERNVKILETKRQELQQMAQVNIEVLTDVLRTTSAR